MPFVQKSNGGELSYMKQNMAEPKIKMPLSAIKADTLFA